MKSNKTNTSPSYRDVHSKVGDIQTHRVIQKVHNQKPRGGMVRVKVPHNTRFPVQTGFHHSNVLTSLLLMLVIIWMITIHLSKSNILLAPILTKVLAWP